MNQEEIRENFRKECQYFQQIKDNPNLRPDWYKFRWPNETVSNNSQIWFKETAND